MPKLDSLEHTALLVAAAGLGAKIATGTHVWLIALIGGLAVAAVSFVVRKGWQAPPAA